jgi:adenylate cyclase class 2
MKNEYEGKAIRIDKDEIRAKLKELGAKLVFEEKKFSRYTFDLPKSAELSEKDGAWIRLRTDGDSTELTLKVRSDTIDSVKEVSFNVENVEPTLEFLKLVGCKQKNFQENLRERWELDGVEFDIDTWPKANPWLEIEAESEDKVKEYFEKLGLDFSKAYFGSADIVFSREYDMDILKMPELKFD